MGPRGHLHCHSLTHKHQEARWLSRVLTLFPGSDSQHCCASKKFHSPTIIFLLFTFGLPGTWVSTGDFMGNGSGVLRFRKISENQGVCRRGARGLPSCFHLKTQRRQLRRESVALATNQMQHRRNTGVSSECANPFVPVIFCVTPQSVWSPLPWCCGGWCCWKIALKKRAASQRTNLVEWSHCEIWPTSLSALTLLPPHQRSQGKNCP